MMIHLLERCVLRTHEFFSLPLAEASKPAAIAHATVASHALQPRSHHPSDNPAHPQAARQPRYQQQGQWQGRTAAQEEGYRIE